MNEDRDEFENYYLRFKQSLEVLASTPEEACDLLDHYNVAFETKSDIGYAVNLLDHPQCPLTNEQRAAVTKLLDALEHVPADVLAFTDVLSESLARMRHPSWVPLRTMARQLLADLEPISRENQRYFAQGSA